MFLIQNNRHATTPSSRSLPYQVSQLTPLYGDPTWSPFSNNILLKAYAWIDPELACQKALELSERYSKEAQVRKLELLTTVISELNTIAIRKGMLRHRK